MFPSKGAADSFREETTEKGGTGRGDKLPGSLAETDKKKVENAGIISDMVNHSVGFTPDLAFENLVKDYASAKKLYGPTLIRKLTGFTEEHLLRNIRLPEFRRELKGVLEKKMEEMMEEGLLDREGQVTEEGYELSAAVLYLEELESLRSRGYGDKLARKISPYGERSGQKSYARGDPYRDIGIRSSIKKAARRARTSLSKDDLVVFRMKDKSSARIVYAIDNSGSMRGRKIEMAKRAGFALMYQAIENRDKIGLVTFRSDIAESIPPSDDFRYLATVLSKARAFKETDIAKAIRESIALLSKETFTRHIVLITDAMPTVGSDPFQQTLEEAAAAYGRGITISVVGIQLTEKGIELAKKIAETSGGRFYIVRDLEDMDIIVLDDYSRL